MFALRNVRLIVWFVHSKQKPFCSQTKTMMTVYAFCSQTNPAAAMFLLRKVKMTVRQVHKKKKKQKRKKNNNNALWIKNKNKSETVIIGYAFCSQTKPVAVMFAL